MRKELKQPHSFAIYVNQIESIYENMINHTLSGQKNFNLIIKDKLLHKTAITWEGPQFNYYSFGKN